MEGHLEHGRQRIARQDSAEPNVLQWLAQIFGVLCYNLIHRAGTDALVTVLAWCPWCPFPPEFWIYGVETVETGETVDSTEVQ
jgi:hypothetical protein